MAHRFALKPCLLYTLLVLMAACGTRPSDSVPAVPEGVASADSSSPVAADAQAVAAAYRQRLRLGLGSPYRLIEIAMRDSRLGAERTAVARDLLLQIEHGSMYEVTPLALVAAGVSEANAIAQLELVRQAIESTSDPRIGELAVKLAYELAAAEQTVAPEIVGRMARVAAVIRDGRLAAQDHQRLREGARRLAVAPENLVLMWRDQRVFAVEQPTLTPLDPAAQEEAARLSLLLVGGIRSAVAPVVSSMRRTVPIGPTQLAADAAATLLNSKDRAAQDALLITMRALRAGAAEAPAHPLNLQNWKTFFEQARDEESLVAALSAARRSRNDDILAAGIALDAAVALRPFAQERITARRTASAQDLQTRFGVRITYDARVSDQDRTRVVQVLTDALEDLRTVIRTIDLSGLTFRAGPLQPAAAHLAYHEPRKRVIHLDPETMAGTIAHEIGHDLDWQLAARKYRTRSTYATDYATRTRRTLAYAVENLVEVAPMNAPAPDDPTARRPAEIFARRFEWYVASSLAQHGRSNGYLSSAQDDWIAGYGAAVRPDPTPTAANSFAAILADATNMGRIDAAAVAQTVMETTPVAIRVLVRAQRATDRATFEEHSLAELSEWECGSALRAPGAVGTSMRWFVQALGEAVYPTSEIMLTPAIQPVSTQLVPRSMDIASLIGGSCTRLVY